MPTLSTSELRDDINKLGAIDKRHSFLATVGDDWFDASGLTILTERDRDDEPLVGVMLKYPYPCPVDKDADFQIKYWLADLNRPDALDAAFKANIAAIYVEMARVGATWVWGAVPKRADHLTVRLNPIATAMKCTRVEGESHYKNFIFYIGEGDTVNTWVQGN